jgi:diketogulonate reductase-like aldo/keto reductase
MMNIDSTLQLHTGGEMPVLGLGTWQLTHDTAGTVEEALRLGYRMIDTSGDYGTQPGVGEAIRRSGLERGRIYLVTKVEEDEDAYEATVRNLRELGLEYADLMLIHRPPARGAGRELWEGLIRARDNGLTRDIGVSNYSIDQIEELIETTGDVPAVNQIEWTPFGWSREMLDYCRERGIVIQAYSPLTRTKRFDEERLVELAAEYDRTPAQLLLRWNLQLGVVPLPKANRRDHLKENLGVFDFELADDHVAELNQFNQQWSALGRTLQYV